MTTARILPRYAGPELNSSGQKMTNEEIRARFNAEVAEAYSQRKPIWLPEYDKVLGLVVKALEPHFAAKESVRVLDLGAGTGNLSRRVLKAFRNSQVTLVDFSQNMLDEVPNVLSTFPGRYEIRQADFWQMNAPAGGYDAVVSSFALHHGRGDAVYQSIYRNIHAWLKPGGIFACCDVVDGDTPELAALNMVGWRQYLTGKLSPADVERMFSNYRREDSPISLRKHLSFLDMAGFEITDVLWKRFNFAVYVGIKNS
jgi:tRNA (cmo5U34)-methyltransferase